jgi:putative transposase
MEVEMRGKQKNHSDSLKAKVVLEVLKGQKTVNEIAGLYQVHPNQIYKWKKKVLQELPKMFSKNKNGMPDQSNDELVRELYQQIGQLKVELDWLKKKSDILY